MLKFSLSNFSRMETKKPSPEERLSVGLFKTLLFHDFLRTDRRT